MGAIISDSDGTQFAHGIVMVIATLVLAPVDMLVGAVLQRWPVAHMVTSVLLFLATVVGFGLGIKISALYIAVSFLSIFTFPFSNQVIRRAEREAER